MTDDIIRSSPSDIAVCVLASRSNTISDVDSVTAWTAHNLACKVAKSNKHFHRWDANREAEQIASHSISHSAPLFASPKPLEVHREDNRSNLRNSSRQKKATSHLLSMTSRATLRENEHGKIVNNWKFPAGFFSALFVVKDFFSFLSFHFCIWLHAWKGRNYYF